MSNKDHFDGDGFSQDPIEGVEAARHRHMLHEANRNWGRIESVSTFMKAMPLFVSTCKIAVPIGICMVGVGAIAKSQGWL